MLFKICASEIREKFFDKHSSETIEYVKNYPTFCKKKLQTSLKNN